MKRFTFLSLFFVFVSNAFSQSNVLSVMSYNLLMYPEAAPSHREDTLAKILEFYPVDILGVCELLSEEGSDSLLNYSLNKGTTKYKAAQFDKATWGDLHQMLYYNSEKLTLYAQSKVASNTRDFNEYVLYLNQAGLLQGDTVFLDVYVCHLKAGSEEANETTRSENVQYLMDYIKGKPQGRNRILMGDLNLYSNQEEAYQKLTKGSIYPFYDPIQKEGNWHNNSSYSAEFTQSTRSAQLYGEGSGGGMDDRFDFILTSYELLDTTNAIHYKSNSYEALGNSGNCFNKSITDCSGDAALLSALYYMSDHLPVVMQLEVKDSLFQSISTHELPEEKVWFSRTGLHVEAPQKCQFEVYNALGKLVFRSKEKSNRHKVEWPLYDLRGVYYVRIQESNKVFKLIR